MYPKWQSCDVWFLRYEVLHTEFFVNLDNFLLFYSPNNPKNQNFEKPKKKPGGIIILHKHTKNYDDMLYCFLDMMPNRYNCYFSIWAIFCPFTYLKARKIKILKSEKNTWRYHHFTIVYQILIICYSVPEIWCMTDVTIFHFRPFFAFLHKKSKFL